MFSSNIANNNKTHKWRVAGWLAFASVATVTVVTTTIIPRTKKATATE